MTNLHSLSDKPKKAAGWTSLGWLIPPPFEHSEQKQAAGGGGAVPGWVWGWSQDIALEGVQMVGDSQQARGGGAGLAAPGPKHVHEIAPEDGGLHAAGGRDLPPGLERPPRACKGGETKGTKGTSEAVIWL